MESTSKKSILNVVSQNSTCGSSPATEKVASPMTLFYLNIGKSFLVALSMRPRDVAAMTVIVAVASFVFEIYKALAKKDGKGK